MKITIKRLDGSLIAECEAESLRAVIESIKNDLCQADLREAYLSGANLQGANLSGANLQKANLQGAHLRWADLHGANLDSANLVGANLCWTDLRVASLSKANLEGANLSDSSLLDANLCGADLRWAILRGANLEGADLTDAILPHFQICPQEGEFVGFKKISTGVIRVLIPADAKRTSSLVGRKCRASALIPLEGNGSSLTDNYPKKRYVAGYRVDFPDYDPDIRVECARGGHFFMTRQEAEQFEM